MRVVQNLSRPALGEKATADSSLGFQEDQAARASSHSNTVPSCRIATPFSCASRRALPVRALPATTGTANTPPRRSSSARSRARSTSPRSITQETSTASHTSGPLGKADCKGVISAVHSGQRPRATVLSPRPAAGPPCKRIVGLVRFRLARRLGEHPATYFYPQRCRSSDRRTEFIPFPRAAPNAVGAGRTREVF